VGPFEVLPDPKCDDVTHFCLPGLKAQLAHTIGVYSVICDFVRRILATDFPYPSHQLVFVDEESAPLMTFAGMSILSTNLLSSSRIIDKHFEARELIARAVMMQYFGAAVIPRAPTDVWLTLGISGYLTGLFVEETFGRNEYRHYTYRKHEEVCQADAERDLSHKEQRHRPLITQKHHHVSEYFSQFAQNKSECVLRILEFRLGQENLLEILTKLLEPKEDESDGILPCMVAYRDFLTMANERSPQQWKELLMNWVECEVRWSVLLVPWILPY
jgi:transcription initiation factor TFIID subunit 2